MKGQRLRVTAGALEEGRVKSMDRDAAGPEAKRAIGVALVRDLGGEVTVLDDLRSAIDADNVADALQRFALGNGKRGHFGLRQNMVAQECGVAHLDQWVIDLEIEQVLQSA